jgi:hypothetical protein
VPDRRIPAAVRNDGIRVNAHVTFERVERQAHGRAGCNRQPTRLCVYRMRKHGAQVIHRHDGASKGRDAE